MYRFLFAAGLALATATPVMAQSWAPWHQPNILEMYGPGRKAGPSAKKSKRANTPPTTPSALIPGGPVPTGLTAPSRLGTDGKPSAPAVVQGGPRPDIDPRSPKAVKYRSGQAPGTIVIDTKARRLYLVTSSSRALSYPVSVGREGFQWSGTEKISRVKDWPDWHPPAEMRERDPRLPTKMTGGLYNPLGAKALYLGSTLYRIHGTSDSRSIGRAASSGCFRMHNSHVVDLARRVGIGTKVVVINATSTSQQKTASASQAR